MSPVAAGMHALDPASPASTARSTSARVMRPPRPVPSIRAGSMSCWRTARFTEGESLVSAMRTVPRRRPGPQACVFARLGPGLRRGTPPVSPTSATGAIRPSTAPGTASSSVCEQYLAQHAGGGRRHLHRHLVGLELDQRIVLLDPVADLPEPGADHRLGALLLRGDEDVDHVRTPPIRRSSRGSSRPTAPPSPAAPDYAGSECPASSPARPARRDR